MPYKSEKIRLPTQYDRRIKLTEKDKDEIIKLYGTGKYSWKKLAEKYHISKSRVGQIVNPQRNEQVKQRLKEHWQDYKPTKEEWNKITREHRHYKQKLFLDGKIKECENHEEF